MEYLLCKHVSREAVSKIIENTIEVKSYHGSPEIMRHVSKGSMRGMYLRTLLDWDLLETVRLISME